MDILVTNLFAIGFMGTLLIGGYIVTWFENRRNREEEPEMEQTIIRRFQVYNLKED